MEIRITPCRWLCFAAVASWCAAPLQGQAIRGVVRDDENLAPVSAATVRLVIGEELGVGTESDARGHFALPVPREGEYRLEVSRLGYRTARSQAVWIEKGDTLNVEFRVSPDAILLDPITVTGRSRRGRQTFERRREDWHKGVFLTPHQIDSIAPRHPADVLRGIDKVVVHWGWGELSAGGYGPVPSVHTFLGRGCMFYMVDHIPVMPPPWARGDWNAYQLSSLSGKDIVAVEVYRSYLEVPPELVRYTERFRPVFSANATGMRYEDQVNCGLTVFWTRAGW